MPIAVVCGHCSSTFLIPPSWAGKRRFCNPACRDAFRASQRLRCAGCGALFNAPPSQRARFCSRACARIGREKTIADRFWPKVDQTGKCWVWTGHRNWGGYGRVSIGTGANRSLYRYAHRVSYELAYGPVPEGQSVLHRCDNPPCVRPEHLFLGTQRDNNDDRDTKNRVQHGSSHVNAKLTEADARRARTLYATGAISQRALADVFGVSHRTISDLLRGLTWKRA